MGTQGTGRKRNPNKERTTAEDDALNLIAREAEARLAAKRAARAEAREIRMKELERQQKEISDDDERMSVGSRGSVRVEDRDYLEKGSRAASTLSTATIASLGGTSSRRGSGDTAITADAEASREIKEIHELKDQIQDVESKYMQNLKEVKDALVEVEEKYRRAMVSNAQLDNEKNNLMYQTDTLKDSLMELEELLAESRREYDMKAKDYERERHAHGGLQFQFNDLKETLKQSEELLTEIRQLRMKEDGFNREISDLQETVEWKDKKIGALERQKEYSDAIRNERDELRDEVVQLKDILKKHGIVIGPDLTTNGETAEAGTDGSAGGDPTSRLAQDSQATPTEGNSVLGRARETQVGGNGGAELDRAGSRQRQQRQEEEEGQENHLTPPDHRSLASVLGTETPREKQTGSPTKMEDDASKDFNNDIAIVEVKKSVCNSEVQVIVTGPEDEIKAEREGYTAAGREGWDVGELGSGEVEAEPNKVKVDDLETIVSKSSYDLKETSPKKPAADEDIMKRSMPVSQGNDQSKSNPERQQEPDDTENAEDKNTKELSPEKPSPEEPSSKEPSPEKLSPKEPSQEKPSPEKPSPEKPSPEEPSPEEPSPEEPLPEEPSPEVISSQPQGGGSPSKKKRKKKRAKKKKGPQGDGAQGDDTTTMGKNPPGPDTPVTREEEPGEEIGVETRESPVEILKESHTDQAKDESPVMEKDQMPIQGTERSDAATTVSCSKSDSGVSNPSDDPKCRTSTDNPNVEPESPTKTEGIEINLELSESTDLFTDKLEPTSKTDNVADESQQTRNTGVLGDTSEFRTNTENEGEFESPSKTETSESTADGDYFVDCSEILTGYTTTSDSFVDCPETPIDLKCQFDSQRSTSIIPDSVKEEDAITVSEADLSATVNTIKQEPGVDCPISDVLRPELEDVEHEDLIHTGFQVAISPDHFSTKATEDLEEMVKEEIHWRDQEPEIDNDKFPEDSDKCQNTVEKCCDTSLDSNCFVEAISKDEQLVDLSDCLPDNKLLNEICEAEGVDAATMAACLTEQVHVESGSGTDGYSDPNSEAAIEVACPSSPPAGEQEDASQNEQDDEVLESVRQDREEEEEENEEGESFEFDDLDSFGDVPKTHQGNVEPGLETESKEDDSSTLEHSQSNAFNKKPDEDMGPQLLTQEEPNKSNSVCVWDRLTEQIDPAVEALEEDLDGTPDDQSPNEKGQTPVKDVLNQSEEQLASVTERVSIAHEQRELSEEGLGLTVGQQNIAEGESVQTRAQASLGEEGGGAMDNGLRGERLGSQNTVDPIGGNDERSRKGSKSNSKKEIRLRKLVDERENLMGQVKKLKAQVEQKQPRNGTEDGSSPPGEVLENGTDPNILEMQRDASRQLSDLKFKLVKAEQEVTALEQNVTRLDGQVTRYKSATENSEKVEDELKAEKRKLQRELRTALDKIDELESNNSHLSKRLDKMKANRSTAATP